ncbi:hypothetical protein H0H81_002759 [Sphagnurus paluster]|uniref:Uncharacterized protein n=1 Tax=Sphagnurus paluster TaxID=117069 RepID=A0A9P7KHR7_9AGAR|nr:hypothetical protein H0H81_002759 [Sphagnurus paluster]
MLQNVHFCSGHSPLIKIPWGQIRSFELGSFIDIDDIFTSARQLSKLILPRLSDPELDWQDIPVIRHSNIRTLITQSLDALGRLEIPSLEFLHFSGWAYDTVALDDITLFITQSSCSLQTLIISPTMMFFEKSELQNLLNHTPFLVNLTIDLPDETYWEIVTHVLTVTSSRPHSVPRLENITLSSSRKCSDFDISLLLEMLESRASPEIVGSDGACRLGSISLHNLPDTSEGQVFSVLSRLYKLSASGIRVNLDPVVFHRMMFIGETYSQS